MGRGANTSLVRVALDRHNGSRKLVLGIDTGGTYTDGVLFDYDTRSVLTTHKSLTTKRDFAIGIERVIEGIAIEDPSEIRMVSVSTTLATNAIAEGKGKRVALLLVGYDPELISSFKLGVRFATPNYHFFVGGHDLYGREKELLDLPAILDKVNEIKRDVDAFAVSSYFSPLNPEHENRVAEAISRISDLPIVLGHQLSTRLGSVERATTAALNASLLAVLQDFVIAVRRAMESRQIDAPLMMVRGDGTLMSDEFASRTPVETIHSGPAASAIGGRFLAGLDDILVLDVGGTTTDLALIERGEVTVGEEGASVGDYKTAVSAADLFSVALGGDSHITLDSGKHIALGPERVVPLAHLAANDPRVTRRLRALSRRAWAEASPDWLEYWFLLRQPHDDSAFQSTHARKLVAYLDSGPKPLPEIVDHLGVLHVAQIGPAELWRQEIIGKAGLTPTDLLHVERRYTPWDSEASELALQVFSHYQFKEPDEIRDAVWRQAVEMIVHAVISFLTKQTLVRPGAVRPQGDDDIGRWFFLNSIYSTHPHLKTQFRLQEPIVGIGAPAGFFLEDVARVLNARLILPEHYEVANALGAIAGSVMVVEEVLVYPRLDASGLEVLGFYVQTSEQRTDFDEEALDECLTYARDLARERALGAAIRSGADNPQVVVGVETEGLDTYRIQARAMGNPRLAR
jgi:N-methylhydantoinase A/oxoprolinase/acetone carboxylase beta subunit